MKSTRPLPSIELLRDRFTVSASSQSGLAWRISRPGGLKAGDRAGWLEPTGYWRVRVGGRRVLVHRIIFALVYGGDDPDVEIELPPDPVGDDGEIDHIDRDTRNNHPANLRAATHGQNQCNSGGSSRGSSVYCGVYRSAQYGNWIAEICGSGERRYLGRHRCETAAALAYDRAARDLHGSFARMNLGA